MVSLGFVQITRRHHALGRRFIPEFDDYFSGNASGCFLLALTLNRGRAQAGKYNYSGLHLNEETAGKDARAPSSNCADYSYLRAYEIRCNVQASDENWERSFVFCM